MRAKIAIVGGHLTPALATIDELKKSNKNLSFIFLGRSHSSEGDQAYSAEYQTITSLAIKFLPLLGGRLQRHFSRYTISSLAKVPFSFLQAFWYLSWERPHLVIAFGGYLSLPVIWAAWLISIPTIIHEQSARPGLANRIGALFADKIAVSFGQTTRFFPKGKVVITGNLLRRQILKPDSSPGRIDPFLRGSRESGKPLILVTGGNQGSHTINLAIEKILPQLLERFFILHQAGSLERYNDLSRLKKNKSAGYLVDGYLSSCEMGKALAAADLLISRSGANICTEIALLGKVAILIPLPLSAYDEQRVNAQILQKAGSCEILEEKDLTPHSLLRLTERVFKKRESYLANVANARKIFRDGTRELVKEALKLLPN